MIVAAKAPPARPLRVVFFGSQDNLGYRFAKWLRDEGHHAEVYAFEPDLGRSQPELLDPGLRNNYPPWFHVHHSPIRYFPRISGRLRRRLESDFDLMVASGTRGLLASRRVRLPKLLHSIGGEVAEAPFPFAGRWQGLAAAVYRLTRWPFARLALRRMDTIIENYTVNVRCLERLGLMDRRVTLPMAEDIAANRRMVVPALLRDLEQRYGQYSRVFLWLSRLNYCAPDDAAYKGADRFLRALSAVRSEILCGDIRLVIGTHGHDVEAFQSWAEREGYGDHIDWVPHLSYGEMLTYLSLPNAVLFGKFGENLTILSGMDRDALSTGTVTVTTFDADYIDEIYGGVPPYLPAITDTEVSRRMVEVANMSPMEFASRQRLMAEFGMNHLNIDAVMPQYVALLRNVIREHRMAPN
ncbi:MAG: hypothetical protein HQ495_12820 [Alphaproteobacteria bacterium]|nr:hypothetical protein [Alphaproteobacteria bacterium]